MAREPLDCAGGRGKDLDPVAQASGAVAEPEAAAESFDALPRLTVLFAARLLCKLHVSRVPLCLDLLHAPAKLRAAELMGRQGGAAGRAHGGDSTLKGGNGSP